MESLLDDAVAVYVNSPICAVVFVARWPRPRERRCPNLDGPLEQKP
jgi:hypothetical protein